MNNEFLNETENEYADISALETQLEIDEVLESEKMPRQAKKRSEFTPPEVIGPDMSLFDYLCQCNPPLDRKLVEVSISQSKVPTELRGDAAQEIRIMWTTFKPDIRKYKPQQIAAYAHRMALHACLRTRRELGSSVRLPGSAFRKKADGSSYVTPGVLAAPLDWNEMESWFDTDNLSDSPMSGSQFLSLDDDALEEMFSETEAETPATSEEDARFSRRIDKLEEVREQLTETQYEVMRRLIDGDSYDEVRKALKLSKAALQRAISQAVTIVGVF